MSSIRTQSLRSLTSPNESQRRSRRLASRVSEFDSRVTIFEPGNDTSVPSSDRPVDAAEEPESPKRPRKRVKLESETDIADIEDLVSVQTSPRTDVKEKRKKSSALEDEGTNSKLEKQSNPRSPSKVKLVPQTLDKPHPAPPNWRETYDTIKTMRSRFIAPVDTMGCAEAQTGETLPRNRRYATLVSLMLSSQTKDEVTYAAIINLRAAFGGSISLEAMIEADEQVISDAISKVGFWKKKTVYLKQAAIKLRDDFKSDVPDTVDELCSLPGVGPKMAFLTLQTAWGLNHGIGVDVHVHRITNLLGWHKPPTNTPERTRLNLQSWLPKELHYEINQLLVGFGQVICLPVNPRCDICDVKRLCPSANTMMKSSKNRKDIIWIDQQEALGDEGSLGPKVEIEEEQKVLEAP